MKTYESITGYKPHTYNGRIITYGLTEEENLSIQLLMRCKNYEVYNTTVASDLVALLTTAIIVNSNKLETDDFALLENYYTEVGKEADEIVFWIGSPLPSIELQMRFKSFDSFDDMVPVFGRTLI